MKCRSWPERALEFFFEIHSIVQCVELLFFRCGGAVFEAEKLTVKDDVYHKRCFTCMRCSRPLDSLIVMTSTDGNIYCKVCYKVVHAPDRPQVMTDLAVIPAEEEKDGCPRCSGKVRYCIKGFMSLDYKSAHKKSVHR